MNKFVVIIEKNWHPHDEVLNSYGFNTYKEARNKAKELVIDTLESLWKQ